MKAKDVAIGTRVSDPQYRYKTGKIASNDIPEGDDLVTVEWDDEYSWRKDKREPISIYDLRIIPVPLEADFAKLREQFQIVVNAIQAANRIAMDRDTNLYELDKEEIMSFQEVFNALDNAGWQTSTMTRSC